MTDFIKRERMSPNLAQEYHREQNEAGLRALQEFDIVTHLLEEVVRAHKESGSLESVTGRIAQLAPLTDAVINTESLTDKILRMACESNQK